MNNVWINKSGKSYPVKKNVSGGTTQIGNILSNEIFGSVDPGSYDLYPGDAGPGCVFRNASGQRDFSGFVTIGNIIPNGLFTPVSDSPYSTVTISGKSYKTFKTRRQITLVKPSGATGDIVPAGVLVALAMNGTFSFSGDTNMDYIAVAHKQNSSGVWSAVTSETPYSYAFAPIGLDYGSGASSLNLIGTF